MIERGEDLVRNPLLAKSNPIETIKEHTEKLIEQFNKLKLIYPYVLTEEEWILLKYACLYHDLGKVNTKFQNVLLEKLERSLLPDELKNVKAIPHGYLSGAFLPLEKLEEKYNDDLLRVLYQSIFYHHIRPDNAIDDINRTIKEDLPQYVSLLREVLLDEKWWEDEAEIAEPNIDFLDLCYGSSERITASEKEDNKKYFLLYIKVKGLLNKIDYAASTGSLGIDVEIKNDGLHEQTMNFMNESGFEPNDLQEHLLNNQDQNNVVIASTGIGKTEGALLWIGKGKGIFTLPLKVSINAIYERIKEKIQFENVGVLHSDTISVLFKEQRKKEQNLEDFDIELLDKTKQLSFPLTVCTLDQIIDFVAFYPGFEAKLATLSYSKLVIDEIQMYSPRLVGILLVGLKKLTEIGGKFTILTATFPPVLHDFMQDLAIPYQEAPNAFVKKNEAGKDVVRHKISIIENDISAEDILKNHEGKKVLIIVNTVKKAQQLYEDLSMRIVAEDSFECLVCERAKNSGETDKNCADLHREASGNDSNKAVHLLHSRFIVSDRSKKEAALLRMGQNDCQRTGVWITTQIVEASLDIDFDVLYTELSEVCGLFQRMGRVFRGRELENDAENVFVYTGKTYTSGINDSKKSIVDHQIFELSKKELHYYHGQILEEKDKMKIVERVYDREKLRETQYYRGIEKAKGEFMGIIPYELEKNQVKLRDIQDEIIIPNIIFRGNEERIEELCSIIRDHHKKLSERIDAREELKDFTVTVPSWVLDKAKKEGWIHSRLNIDKFNVIPVVSLEYTSEKGIIYQVDQDSMFF